MNNAYVEKNKGSFFREFTLKNPFDITYILKKSKSNELHVVFENEAGKTFSHFQSINQGEASKCFSFTLWNCVKPLTKQLVNGKDEALEEVVFLETEPVQVFHIKLVRIKVESNEEFIQLILNDRTSLELERKKLLETKQKYESVLEYNLDPLISVDSNGRILYLNNAVNVSFGYKQFDLENKKVIDYLDESSKAMVSNLLQRAFKGQSMELQECNFLHFDNRLVAVHMKAIPVNVNGNIESVHLIVRDVSPHMESKEKLFYLSYHDHLTGLWNRRALKEHLKEDLRFSELQQEELAFIYIDLDRFKLINDSLGYNAGDDLMIRVSDRLKQFSSRFKKLYRLSGDEFVFILKNASREKSEQLSKSILEELHKPYYVDHQEYFISVSIGISLYPTDGKGLDTLLKKADQALFYVKERGRAHFRFYREEMNHAFPNEALMESHLRRAIEMEEMYIHFQPQVSLENGSIHSFEALLRWNNKKFGFVAPSQFIPLAEESGIILQLGDWVLHQVCEKLQEWQQKGFDHMRIAVNISSMQFQQEDFVERIENLITIYKINPSSLEVEITESAMMNTRETLSVLTKLKKIGVIISIDDFGTGYSSLSYLKRYPIDIIKIDQSFIRGIEMDDKNAAIAKTIIHLAHSLGMEVIAEGVEKLHQVDILKSVNCHKAQGFYFSKPVSMKEVEEKYFN